MELKIEKQGGSIYLGDLDQSNEAEVYVSDLGDSTTEYINKEDMLLMRNHLDYLIKKIDK